MNDEIKILIERKNRKIEKEENFNVSNNMNVLHSSLMTLKQPLRTYWKILANGIKIQLIPSFPVRNQLVTEFSAKTNLFKVV